MPNNGKQICTLHSLGWSCWQGQLVCWVFYRAICIAIDNDSMVHTNSIQLVHCALPGQFHVTLFSQLLNYPLCCNDHVFYTGNFGNPFFYPEGTVQKSQKLLCILYQLLSSVKERKIVCYSRYIFFGRHKLPFMTLFKKLFILDTLKYFYL